MSTKENALREQGGSIGYNTQINYTTKRFPPYGKQLDEIRRKGLIPARRVIVSTDWKLGAAYPRVVIPSDAQIENLNFTYLSGLSAQIVHHADEAELVRNLIEQILKVKPKVLMLFNFDIAKQNDPMHSAVTLIHPTWEFIKNGL